MSYLPPMGPRSFVSGGQMPPINPMLPALQMIEEKDYRWLYMAAHKHPGWTLGDVMGQQFGVRKSKKKRATPHPIAEELRDDYFGFGPY